MPLGVREELTVDTGFMAVTDLEAREVVVTGSLSPGQPLDTAIRCLKMSPRLSPPEFLM